MNGERRISSIRCCYSVKPSCSSWPHLSMRECGSTGIGIERLESRKPCWPVRSMSDLASVGCIHSGPEKPGLVTQGFALFGTLIGMVTIIVGVGPRTNPDILYHLCMVGLLSWGLLYTIRAPTDLSEKAERPCPRRAA